MSIILIAAQISTPLDNGTNATTSITITPPLYNSLPYPEGWLVLVYLTQRGTATFSVGVNGGQTWNSLSRNVGTANVASQVFWTRFNGTWSANPRFDFSTGTNTTAILLGIQYNDNFGVDKSSTIDWNLERDLTSNNAATTTQTISGVTASSTESFSLASWHTADDNTWGNLTGANWNQGGLVQQYRNLAGSDSSSAFAFHNAGVNVPSVSLTQLTLGADATLTRLVTFYATPYSSFSPSDPMGQRGFFGL